MRQRIGLAITLLTLLAGSSARAQYGYPGGYGGFGGWGVPVTAAGSHAMGMGAFAAGAGAYNEQTAEARSMNAQTAMGVNEYMYQSQQRRNRDEQQLLAQRQQLVNATAETNYNRILNQPDAHDIHVGDAENVIFDQLVNPVVYANVLEAATQPIPSATVKEIPLSFAPQAMTICLDEYTQGGAPDILLTSQAFAEDRAALKAIVAQARKEAEGQGAPAPETMAKAREIVKAAEAKVKTAIPEGPDRRAADNYLKGLYGLTKMVQKPDIESFLKGLDTVDTTTLAHLISFMHTFSLRFGAASTPEQEAAYDQLYPMLVNLRDTALQPGQATTPFQASAEPPDHSKVTQFFSGIAMDHLAAPAGPAAGQVPPPPAAQP